MGSERDFAAWFLSLFWYWNIKLYVELKTLCWSAQSCFIFSLKFTALLDPLSQSHSRFYQNTKQIPLRHWKCEHKLRRWCANSTINKQMTELRLTQQCSLSQIWYSRPDTTSKKREEFFIIKIEMSQRWHYAIGLCERLFFSFIIPALCCVLKKLSFTIMRATSKCDSTLTSTNRNFPMKSPHNSDSSRNSANKRVFDIGRRNLEVVASRVNKVKIFLTL